MREQNRVQQRLEISASKPPPRTASLGRTFLRDNTVVTTAHLLGAMSNVFLTALVLKTAGDGPYGAYVLLSTVLVVLFGSSSLGVGFRYKRNLPSTDLGRDRGDLFYAQFYFQTIVITLLCAALAALTPTITERLTGGRVLLGPWMMPGFLLCYFVFTQVSDYFRYTLRIHYAMVVSLLQSYGQIGLLLVYRHLYGQVTLEAIFYSYILATFFAVAAPVLKLIRELGVRGIHLDPKGLLEDARLGYPLILNFLAEYALASTARYVLALKLSLEAVAWFSAAFTLANVISIFPRVAGTLLPPLMARAVDTSSGRDAQQVLTWSLRLFFVMSLPFVAGSAIVSRDLLLLLGDAHLADNAWRVVPLLATSGLFSGLVIILNSVLFVTKNTGLLFRITVIAAGANVAFTLLGLQAYPNVLAPAVAHVVSYAIALLVLLRKIKGQWEIKFEKALVVKSAVASAVMAFATVAVRSSLPEHIAPFSRIAVALATAFVTYALLLYVLRAVTPEIAFLKRILRTPKS